jgi:hypothetical protein
VENTKLGKRRGNCRGNRSWEGGRGEVKLRNEAVEEGEWGVGDHRTGECRRKGRCSIKCSWCGSDWNLLSS